MSSLKRTRFHILLVEDDPLVQKVHRKMLEADGHQVTSAMNGAEALELCMDGIKNRSYTHLLIDGSLPDLPGFKLCQLIRWYEKILVLQPVPVILITADDVDADTQRRWMDIGVTQILIKPVLRETMKDNLLKVLGG